MSSREDRAQTPVRQEWTAKELARELVIILSASAGVITVLMLLKGLQAFI